MKQSRSWLIAASLCICIGIAAFLFSAAKKPKQWILPKNNALTIELHNPQKILRFGELLSTKNTLNSDFGALINPLEYVLVNGLLKSITGYLLLDLSKPTQIALQWNENNPYLLATIPSHFGLEGAQNLARNMEKYAAVQKEHDIWRTRIQIPSIPNFTLFWTGKSTNILMAATLEETEENYYFHDFQCIDTKNIEYSSIQWNQTYAKNFQTPLEKLSLTLQTTDSHLFLKGEGFWNSQEISKSNYHPNLIAGWNLEGIDSFEIHELDDGTQCVSKSHPKLQTTLSINKICKKTNTSGMFVFISSKFFQSINIPIEKIEMSIWTEGKKLHINGELQKKTPRALFSWYIWLYEFYTEQKIAK